MAGKKLKRQDLLGYEASRNAKHALVLSIVGIFIFGLILEPMALYYAIKSHRTLNDINNGDNASYAMASIAMIIAGIALVITAISLLTIMFSAF